jgi:hypothetical protein
VVIAQGDIWWAELDASQAPLTEYVGRISSRHSARFKRRSFSV